MRYVLRLACVLSVLVASPLVVSAQGCEEGGSTVERSHPEAPVAPTKPASDPALQMGIDSAGLEVTPSAQLTVGHPKLQEMDRRARRARIGLLSTTGVVVVGAVLFGTGVARAGSSEGLDALSEGPLLISGISLMVAGAAGMIASGIVLGSSKGELRRLREARYGTPDRAQWDLEAQSGRGGGTGGRSRGAKAGIGSE